MFDSQKKAFEIKVRRNERGLLEWVRIPVAPDPTIVEDILDWIAKWRS